MLTEPPRAIAPRTRHQRLISTGDDHVTGGPESPRGSALPIEVRGRLVLIEVREDRCQRLAPLDCVGRVGSLAAHEHCEARVDGEQCFLALGVAPIRAVGVGVEELSNRESIGGFSRSHLNVHGVCCIQGSDRER